MCFSQGSFGCRPMVLPQNQTPWKSRRGIPDTLGAGVLFLASPTHTVKRNQHAKQHGSSGCLAPFLHCSLNVL